MLTVILFALCALFFVMAYCSEFDLKMKGRKRNFKVLTYYITSLIFMVGWVLIQVRVV